MNTSGMNEEFNDFKPALGTDEVNETVKKVVEKEMSELEIFKEENDFTILGYDDPKQALTEMMVGYIQNVGDVTEVNYCSYNAKGEAIDAWSFSGDEEFMSVDLFLTVLVDPEKSNTLPKSEIERYFKWLEKFYNHSQSGEMLSRIDDMRSDLYQIAQLINEAESIDRVRLFLLTNAIAPNNLDIDEKETDNGTILEYHLWDVKRIKKHDDILRGKDPVIVDFEEKGFNPLPCLKMPDVSDRVECYLAIIPGETLSKIYNRYHQHILEQNVRTFLQFKGASNKGIRDTLIGHIPTNAQRAKGDRQRDPEPDMFFSYNNGISTTAADIEVVDKEQGPVITKITDWQIVNGGQTTASISAVMKMKNTDPELIKQVFVAMKVSVIKDKEIKDDLVPRIARFANTQSAVKNSDIGINEPFLQDLELQSRNVWVKNSMNKEISKWFFERTRGQYMDKAKHTANAKEEREYYAEYPKNQMFDKTTLAKFMMSWGQNPAVVCRGGENCYDMFLKQIQKDKVHVDESEYKKTIAKLIIFRAIDAYYGKDGVKLAGFKSQMVAYTFAVLSKLTNQALNLLGIWDEQCVVSSPLYNDLDGNLLPIYIRVLMGNESITYKTKINSFANGKKCTVTETKTVQQSEIEKIKETILFKTLLIVKSIHPIVCDHLFDVDAGIAIDTNAKKTSCWETFCKKHIENQISVPQELLSSKEDFELTPTMRQTIEKASSFDYETWNDISIWGRETGLISPRDAALIGGIYFWCKRKKKLSYKQAWNALRILDAARSKGWEE